MASAHPLQKTSFFTSKHTEKKTARSHDLSSVKNTSVIEHVKSPVIASTPEPVFWMTEQPIHSSLYWMSVFNERRLYWVWGGGLLDTLIRLLPDDFFHTLPALSALNGLSFWTGGLSWALYYLRFSIRLGLLLKHTLPSSWLSDAEQQMPWQARLAAQWHELKFDLLNDFFWASANLACYFWLCGEGIAGYYGGMLTAVLLLMDVSLVIWSYYEQKAQQQPGLAGHYQLWGAYTDILYAVSLCLAFSLLYCFFVPPAVIPAATALMFSVIGNVLCFSLNAVFAAIKQGLDVCQSVTLANDLAEVYEQSHAHETALAWNHQKRTIAYQQMKLLRAVVIDVAVPPLVFLALVLMPLTPGLWLLSAGLVAAVASHRYIEHEYNDKKPDLVIDTQVIKPTRTHGFFGTMAQVLKNNPEDTVCMPSQVMAA